MGHKKAKTLEAILKKPNVTLEEVLDCESIIQKCRVQDELLLKYLRQTDHIHELLSAIVTTVDSPEKAIK